MVSSKKGYEMFDLSIDLPTETIEGLFCDNDDDHAAVPSSVVTIGNRTMRGIEREWARKHHDTLMDNFVHVVLNKGE